MTVDVSSIGVAQRLPRFWAVRALEWIGRNSVVPYLAHRSVAEVLVRYLDLPAGRTGSAITFVAKRGVCVLTIRLRPWTSFLYTFPSLRGARVPERAPDAVAATASCPAGNASLTCALASRTGLLRSRCGVGTAESIRCDLLPSSEYNPTPGLPQGTQ